MKKIPFADVWFRFHTETDCTWFDGFMKFVDFDFNMLQPKQIATKCKGQIRSIRSVDSSFDDESAKESCLLIWSEISQHVYHFESLQRLILHDCSKIRDFQAINKLTHLRELEFSHNDHMTNCTMFSGLTNLISLNLAYCTQLKNVDGLEKMTNLQSLNMTN